MPSALDHLFQSLATEASLDALIEEGREEDLYLEFKQKADRRSGDLGDSDRRAFSKALSGFANADGGILVFGIETAKGAEGVDRAAALKPITDHGRFRGRLLDSILNSTQPVVDDVRIETIDLDTNLGYVKILVPQSAKPPHRAILAEHLYWRRVSTGHRRMEHYELEDTFGRRLRPALQIYVELRPRPADDPHEELYFFFLNEGRGVARHVGFLCRLPSNVKVQQAAGGVENATHINAGSPTLSYTNDRSVLHSNGILTAAGYATLIREDKGGALPIGISWYAENMDTRRASATVPSGGRHSMR